MRLAIVASHGPEVAAGVEGAGGLPGLHEGLLRRLLGHLAVAEHPVGHGEDHPAVLAVHGADALGLARPVGRDVSVLQHVGSPY